MSPLESKSNFHSLSLTSSVPPVGKTSKPLQVRHLCVLSINIFPPFRLFSLIQKVCIVTACPCVVFGGQGTKRRLRLIN